VPGDFEAIGPGSQIARPNIDEGPDVNGSIGHRRTGKGTSRFDGVSPPLAAFERGQPIIEQKRFRTNIIITLARSGSRDLRRSPLVPQCQYPGLKTRRKPQGGPPCRCGSDHFYTTFIEIVAHRRGKGEAKIARE
jgi:hypothetical protein